MKRFLMLLFLSFLLAGCANLSDREPVEMSKLLKAKSFEEKKELLKNMVDLHEEFDISTKNKIKSLLLRSLDQAKDLKKRESQLIQEILRQTIVKKASYDQMIILKKELKHLYQLKYRNFEKAITKLKEIVGIKPRNESLFEELRVENLFGR